MSKVKTPPDSDWRIARTEEDAETLLARTRGFHDVFFRVASVDSGTYVDNRQQSLEKQYPSLWVLIQTQWADTPVVEFIFDELKKVEFVPGREPPGSVELDSSSCRVIMCGWEISSAKLFFRFGGSKDLGPSPPNFHERNLPSAFTLVGD